MNEKNLNRERTCSPEEFGSRIRDRLQREPLSGNCKFHLAESAKRLVLGEKKVIVTSQVSLHGDNSPCSSCYSQLNDSQLYLRRSVYIPYSIYVFVYISILGSVFCVYPLCISILYVLCVCPVCMSPCVNPFSLCRLVRVYICVYTYLRRYVCVYVAPCVSLCVYVSSCCQGLKEINSIWVNR